MLGFALMLLVAVGFIAAPKAYADEGGKVISSSGGTEKSSFPNPSYQGKSNLKEYWDAVSAYRLEISETQERFVDLPITEEEQAHINSLIDTAQDKTDLTELEAIKGELFGLLEAREAEITAKANEAAAIASRSYVYPSGSNVLTKESGVNYFNGRRETWYSQRVLPGGGLNIPGRHVAIDGTIRDADNYIVVAASDLAKGTILETSLGVAKVYDSGCAPGTTDIYVDW